MEAGETAAPVNILEDDNEEEIESGEDFLEKDSQTLPIVKHYSYSHGCGSGSNCELNA